MKRRAMLQFMTLGTALPVFGACQSRLEQGARTGVLEGLPPLPATLPAGAVQGGVIIRRRYVDGPFGQMHLHIAQPIAAGAVRQRPMVCFHPTAVSGAYYRDFMLQMAKDRVVVAPDTPGYGRSDSPQEPQSMAALAEAAAAAMDALGLGGSDGAADLLGFHTGVFIATELAIERPDLVHRLVLPGIPYYEPEVQREKYAQYARATPLDDAGTKVRKEWDFWVSRRDPAVPLRRGAQDFVDQLQALDRGWWGYHGVFSYPAQARLPQVRQPVLIPLIADSLQANTEAASRLLPTVRVEDLTDIERSFFYVGAQRLATLCREFLDGDLTG
ncbi:MAG: alpha/beta fold hydrolase [Pseudomonadota bacterium]